MKMNYLLDVDFEDLKSQKKSLLAAISYYECCELVASDGKYGKEESEGLTGILHLLDSIQDQAVEMGVKEDEVFSSPIDE